VAEQVGTSVDDLAGECRCVCSGLRGVTTATQRKQEMPKIWRRIGFTKSKIVARGDLEITLSANGRTPYGAAILSDCGSCAFARIPRGVEMRVGGWGWQIADEGSAYWIGRSALALICASSDGRARQDGAGASSLRSLIFESLAHNRFTAGLIHRRSGPARVLDVFHNNSVVRKYWRYILADLTDGVCESAAAGDPLATRILDQAAEELCLQFVTVLRKSGIADAADCEKAFLKWGRVLCGHSWFSERFERCLSERLRESGVERFRLAAPEHRPVVGALLHALAGSSARFPPAAVADTLLESARKEEGKGGQLRLD